MIEDALKEISEAGFRVSNLIQIDKWENGVKFSYWRANLNLDLQFDFAEAEDPEEALRQALRKVLKPALRNVEPAIKVSTNLKISDLDL